MPPNCRLAAAILGSCRGRKTPPPGLESEEGVLPSLGKLGSMLVKSVLIERLVPGEASPDAACDIRNLQRRIMVLRLSQMEAWRHLCNRSRHYRMLPGEKKACGWPCPGANRETVRRSNGGYGREEYCMLYSAGNSDERRDRSCVGAPLRR